MLHLPIGLFVGLVAVHIVASMRGRPREDAGRYREPRPQESIEATMLALTSITAVIAATLGWMLASVEADPSTELFRHRWLGTASAVMSIIVWLLFIWESRRPAAAPKLATPYRLGLLALGVLIVATGHYGGTITHGRGFLTEYAPFFGAHSERQAAAASGQSDASAPPEDPELARVLGVIDHRCLKCHNEAKHRGGLRLDTWPESVKPGKSGDAIVVAGDPWNSEIVRRIALPEDDDDAMPPSGRDRVPAEDVLAIIHWIQRGAKGLGGHGANEAESDTTGGSTAAESGQSSAALSRDDFAARVAAAGGKTQPARNDAQRLAIDFAGVESVTNATLVSLLGGANWIVELDLTDTGITDAGLESVAKLDRLEVLTLDGTRVTDDGIMWLADMPNLRKLSVRDTRVTDEGVDSLLLEKPELAIITK